MLHDDGRGTDMQYLGIIPGLGEEFATGVTGFGVAGLGFVAGFGTTGAVETGEGAIVGAAVVAVGTLGDAASWGVVGEVAVAGEPGGEDDADLVGRVAGELVVNAGKDVVDVVLDGEGEGVVAMIFAEVDPGDVVDGVGELVADFSKGAGDGIGKARVEGVMSMLGINL